MSESYLLEWEKWELVKAYITDELKLRGFELSPPAWDPMWGIAGDTVRVHRGEEEYHMFLTCRRRNTFGFGIAKLPLLTTLFNESIPYDSEHKNTILRAINLMGC